MMLTMETGRVSTASNHRFAISIATVPNSPKASSMSGMRINVVRIFPSSAYSGEMVMLKSNGILTLMPSQIRLRGSDPRASELLARMVKSVCRTRKVLRRGGNGYMDCAAIVFSSLQIEGLFLFCPAPRIRPNVFKEECQMTYLFGGTHYWHLVVASHCWLKQQLSGASSKSNSPVTSLSELVSNYSDVKNGTLLAE